MQTDAGRTAAAVEKFRTLTLPRAEWTHEAHLRVGLWFLLHHPPEQALDALRAAIRAFNVHVGIGNSATAGYHETLTRFYVWRISRFLDDTERSDALDALADRLLAMHGPRALPLTYWSRARLFSVEARQGLLPPDCMPLVAPWPWCPNAVTPSV